MSVFDSQGSYEKCILHAFNYPASPHQSTLKSYLHVNSVDSILFSQSIHEEGHFQLLVETQTTIFLMYLFKCW